MGFVSTAHHPPSRLLIQIQRARREVAEVAIAQALIGVATPDQHLAAGPDGGVAPA